MPKWLDWFFTGAMLVGICGLLWCLAGMVMAARMRSECRQLGYSDGGTAGFAVWSGVCVGERKPTPQEHITPIEKARDRNERTPLER